MPRRVTFAVHPHQLTKTPPSRDAANPNGHKPMRVDAALTTKGKTRHVKMVDEKAMKDKSGKKRLEAEFENVETSNALDVRPAKKQKPSGTDSFDLETLISAAGNGDEPTLKAQLAVPEAAARLDDVPADEIAFEGFTALIAACSALQPGCVRLLLAAGANPNQTRTVDETTSPLLEIIRDIPFWYAEDADADAPKILEIISALLDAGANPEYKSPDHDGEPRQATPLRSVSALKPYGLDKKVTQLLQSAIQKKKETKAQKARGRKSK